MESKPTTQPETTVMVEFKIAHPWWEGDGQDESVAVASLRDALMQTKNLGSYRIVEVETHGL